VTTAARHRSEEQRMSMRTIAKCLPAIAMGIALSGCMAPVEEPVTISNSSDTIVTPWGAPSQNSRPAPATAMPASAPENDNLVMMDDPNRKALDDIRQKQVHEARIALGILDRMAQRCQTGDAAACTTLQTNWSTLSQQLHKTLSMLSGDAMQMPTNIPTDDPAMPAMDSNTQMAPAAAPAPTTTPAAPMANQPSLAPTMQDPASGDVPTMEKTIPMTEPGADG
tara:strand:- start:9211 stop:9882 length:672 start_codon:yes stop_codon:yes gene_type:complete